MSNVIFNNLNGVYDNQMQEIPGGEFANTQSMIG